MRTQGEVQSLIAAAARPFRTEFVAGVTTIAVDRARKTVRLPLPATGMSEEQAEAYLATVYDAIALARWADDSAVLRNKGKGKDNEPADPLAYEIGMRRAQGTAVDTWLGDRAVYTKKFAALKADLATSDFSGLDIEQRKAMAASLAALKNIDLPVVDEIMDMAPPEVKRMLDKIDVPSLPKDSAEAAAEVRRILELEAQEQQQEEEQEQDGEPGDGEGEPDDGEGNDDGDSKGKGKGKEDDKEGEGKDKEKPAAPKNERPDPTEKLKPKDVLKGDPAFGADGIGDFICTPDEHVIVYDLVHPERSRNTEGGKELERVLYNHGTNRASCEHCLELPDHIAAAQQSGLGQHIRRLIQVKMRTRYEGGKTSGKINRRAVHRLLMPTVGDGQWNAQVFRKKEVPKDTTNTAVCILVDFSGSMRYHKTKVTIEATGSLSQALTACHVKHAVYTFTEGCNPNDKSENCYNRSLLIGVAKHYDLMQQGEQTMRHMAWLADHQHQNGDVDAVQWAYHDLLKRKEKRKVLLVLSDGYPCSDRYGNGAIALDKFTRKVESEGKVELYGVGILSAAPKEFYRKAVVVNDLKQLEGTLVSLAQGLFDV